MSAVPSLLRVMAHRDAEAIILEAGRVPSLRRRGVVEALVMPALEASMLAEFAAPLLGDRSVDAGTVSAIYTDASGATFPCTIDKAPGGLRIVAKRGPVGSVKKDEPPDEVPEPEPAAAVPGPRVVTAGRAHVADGRARLARILAAPLALAKDRDASDILISSGQRARLRVDGRLEEIEVELADDELARCVAALGPNSDHGIELGGTRLRVNAFDHLGGAAIVARLIRDRVPGLGDLGLPPEVASAIEHRDGLVLVCGPTGSGKSTTLASLIDLIDQKRSAHVITLEDPIEYRFAQRRCLIHQREVGTHMATFAEGLRAALREAPDVILLGELRDPETIATALTAAETGHLVLATLHAPNAAGAVDRMIDAFPEAQQRQIRWQLAAVLRTVITQYLLPRRDGGRVVATEVVPVTPAVANIMRKGDLHTLASTIQSGRELGMIPLERTLARLVETGVVSPQVVKKVAADQDLLAALSPRMR